jgi:Ser/Thr protein kinase RdoA (MazF antagonist)
MAHFPVISSILSSSHLAEFIEANYETGTPTFCQLLKAGVNHTYLVQGESGKAVFRIYSFNWRTREEILEEIRLLNILREQNIPVSFPVEDSSGNYIQKFSAPEGERFGVMFSYAEGEKMLTFPPEVQFQIGSLMAKMHLATEKIKLERVVYTPEILLVDSMNHLSRFLKEGREETIWMQKSQKILLNEFGKIKTDQIRHGAVHLDFWFDNVNVNSQNQVTVFDFDFCGNGFLCLDIAYYILQLHSTEKDEKERDKKINRFFEGYESISPIPPEEKRILPMLGVCLYFFYLGVQSQRFENWSNVFFNELYLQRFILLLVKKYFDANGLADHRNSILE